MINLTSFILIFVFIFGACIGSFLNAVIYRLPRHIDLKLKRSACPGCSKTILWYENIPIISYIFLRGKCSSCKFKIPLRYFLLEVSVGIFALSTFPAQVGLESFALFFFYLNVFCCFICLFFIDLEHKILPDSINIYLGILFISYSFMYLSWKMSLLGAVIGFLFPLTVTWIFYKIKGQVGLGGGDIKLFGVLGIFLGPVGLLQNLFLSCFLGSIIGLFLLLTNLIKREDPIAFGPFIIIVASFQIFFSYSYNAFWNFFF